MDIRNYIQENRASLFDWSVISISFSLGFIFPTMGDFVKSPGFYNWMFASLLLYAAGAALKHLPLSYRLTHSRREPKQISYDIFLMIGHWLIFLFVIYLSETVFRKILGLAPLTGQETGRWQLGILACIGAVLITWLVYRSKTKRRSKKKYSAQFLFALESIADFFLVTGVSILSFVFWEKGVMDMVGHAKKETFQDMWLLFILLAILFLLFYLPLRYLYFVEDRVGGRNRRRLLLIFIFLIVRALFEIITI